MVFDNYKKAYARIEVPEILLEQAAQKMQKARNKPEEHNKVGRGWYAGLATSCLMIVILLFVFLQLASPNFILTDLNDKQFTGEVLLTNGIIKFHEPAKYYITPLLGSTDDELPEKFEEKPLFTTATAPGQLPDQCDPGLILDSNINGTPLHVGVRGAGLYFAQFMYEDTGYYIEGFNVSQTKFIKEIYKILK
ncbi:MAG: hypothetical protein FWF85_06720 [Clostridiales bacterium]|nr:hypothetical protein [Clostridiales bacterium]